MISIVIPVYNEEKYLEPCLRAVEAQDTSEKVEVIVVDNNSTDATLAIARAHAVRVVEEKQVGVGAARRAGVTAAEGDLIVTIDADTRLPANYVSLMRRRFEADPKLMALGGMFTFYDAPWWKNALRPIIGHIVYWISYALTRGRVGPMGNNMAFRRSDYIKTTGFDPELKFGEDMELVKQLRKFGKIDLDFNILVPTSSRRYCVSKGLLVYSLNLAWYCVRGKPWRNELPKLWK